MQSRPYPARATARAIARGPNRRSSARPVAREECSVEVNDLVLVTAPYYAFAGKPPTLGGAKLTPVRTSAGTPRIPGADRWPRCHELVPWEFRAPEGGRTPVRRGRLIGGDRTTFSERYRCLLDRYGIDRIAEQLREIRDANGGWPLALLCFGNVHRPGQWCHREVFAEYWRLHTGRTIHELAPQAVAVRRA
jgi:hypothetical protein